MSNKQLQLVADLEKDKEQKRAQDFQLAQQHLHMNQQKLEGLEQYRLEYLQQIQVKAYSGVDALHFHQHHQFIAKLDKACEQQVLAVRQATKVSEQRKSLWLRQQQKRKAVEHLLAQKKTQYQARQDKLEQQMLDEIALQKFIRNNRS